LLIGIGEAQLHSVLSDNLHASLLEPGISGERELAVKLVGGERQSRADSISVRVCTRQHYDLLPEILEAALPLRA
jgi:hypothetical protein